MLLASIVTSVNKLAGFGCSAALHELPVTSFGAVWCYQQIDLSQFLIFLLCKTIGLVHSIYFLE